GSGSGAATPNSSIQGGLPGLSGSGASGSGASGQSPSDVWGDQPSAGAQQAMGAGTKLGQKSKSGKNRGSNWGLPGSRGRVTAVTRPIHVAVLQDRLVIVPEKGDDRQAQQLPISPQLQQTEVEAFVTAVQREMRSWGLAVENGYWK